MMTIHDFSDFLKSETDDNPLLEALRKLTEIAAPDDVALNAPDDDAVPGWI